MNIQLQSNLLETVIKLEIQIHTQYIHAWNWDRSWKKTQYHPELSNPRTWDHRYLRICEAKMSLMEGGRLFLWLLGVWESFSVLCSPSSPSCEGDGGRLGEERRVSDPESMESLAWEEEPKEEESGLSPPSSRPRDLDRPLWRKTSGKIMWCFF